MAARIGHNLLGEALRIAQATNRSHPARLTCLLRLAVEALGLSSATLYLPDNNPGYLTRRYSTHALPGDLCRIPFGAGCAGKAALSRARTSFSPELLHDDEPRLPEETDFLALPVNEGGKLVAVLTLASSTGPVSPKTLRGLHPLLPLLGMAAAAAHSALAAERDRRNLSLMASLGKILAAPVQPLQLLSQVAKLCTGSGLGVCAIARLRDDDHGKVRTVKSYRRAAGDRLPALLQQEQLLVDALLPGEGCGRFSPAQTDVGYHALCLPLCCNGRTLGSFTLFGGADLLEPEQGEFLETLATVVSGALSEAISTDRIADFIFENDKKLRELSLLFRMSNTMLSTIKLNKLIHLTLTALTSGPTRFFDRAMLFLTNERSGVLQGMLGVTWDPSSNLSIPANVENDLLSSRWDISEADMAAQRSSDFSRMVQARRLDLDATQNIASQAVLQKRLIYVPSEASSPAGEPHHNHGTAFAASPLIAHGKAVGAVLVDNALSHKAITEEDLRFLQLFTNQAGMAIENSILYNKIEDANRQLCDAQESLLQKERLAAIGEMAAGIAHELKGPLVTIGGFASRLTRKLAEESDERGHADLIVREVLRLESVLSEILLFSKKATICYNRCDLSQIVKESLAVVAPRIEEKQIEVSMRFTRQKLLLLGDSLQLKQVFINLFMNSLDAMEPGGKLAIQAALDHLNGREAVSIRIGDTGGGIPVEALANIFTPFYTTKQGGTGLGLPIANRIITNHGGKIQIVNKPGHGVEFKITVPRHLDYSL